MIEEGRDSKGRFVKGRTISIEQRIAHSKKIKGRKKPEGFAEKLRLANIGKKHSLETRKKLSVLQQKRWKNPIYVKKVLTNLRGCKHSKEARMKKKETSRKVWASYSEEEKKRRLSKFAFLKGKKHRFWKGGVSFKIYGFGWKEKRQSVLEADKYCCVLCHNKKKGKSKLCVHHIDFNKKNSNFENLITLCNGCHKHIHWISRYMKETYMYLFKCIIEERKNVG